MKKYLIYICVLAGMLTSCGKFLDRQPKTQVDAQFMFETEQGFMDALMECYAKMSSRNIYGEHLTMTTIELMAQHWEVSAANMSTQLELKNLDYTSETYTNIIEGMYSSLYAIVVQANDVIGHLDETGNVIKDEDTRKIIEGEAHALRALAHFDVLRLFGDMPKGGTKKVNLAYAEVVTKDDIPAVGYDTFVEKLLADLDLAEELMTGIDPVLYGADDEMPSNFLQFRSFRMNLMAVKALKARVYLYLGETTLANQYANEVIGTTNNDGTEYMTLSGISDAKNKYYSMPSETIFKVSNRSLGSYEESLMINNAYRLTISTYNDMFGSYLTNDIRSNLVWSQTESSSESFAVIRKYKQSDLDEDDDTAIQNTQVLPILRLAEMYLIAIETAPTLEEANSLYSTFMLSRNVVAPIEITEANKYDTIKDEYRREFFAEGQLFFFYKRHFAPMMDYGYRANSLTEKEYMLPLPASEISYNI